MQPVGAEGFEPIEEAHRAGKGIILITGHFGNWELAGAYVASRGIPIEVIVRRMNNPLFDRYVTRTREGAGMIVVHDHDAVRRRQDARVREVETAHAEVQRLQALLADRLQLSPGIDADPASARQAPPTR